MKLAVTGCNGNIGRRVCMLALNAGHTVHGIDSARPSDHPAFFVHSNFVFSQLDLRDYAQTVDAITGSDAIIHLAAIPTPTDYLVHTHNTNVVISWNVLRGAAELGIRRIAQASSVNVVQLVWSKQPTLHYLPLDEDHPREPDEPYGPLQTVCSL
ncbi:uncharacterized protein PHACADRAFT_50982, partial [Phanerochaete carnosa HHB-10118-sp]